MKTHGIFKEIQSSSIEIKTQEKQYNAIHSGEDENYSTSINNLSLDLAQCQAHKRNAINIYPINQ